MKFIVLLLLDVSPIFPLAGQDYSANLANQIKTMLESFERNQTAIKTELPEVNNSSDTLSKKNLNLFRELKRTQAHLRFLKAENAPPRSVLALKNHLINLNTASLDELISLPTADPVMAKTMISNRPCSSIEAVTQNLHFIPAKLKEIAGLITV